MQFLLVEAGRDIDYDRLIPRLAYHIAFLADVCAQVQRTTYTTLGSPLLPPWWDIFTPDPLANSPAYSQHV